jgi:hypothetical protein
MGRCRETSALPSASAWCVPVGVRPRAPLSKRPGSPSLVSVFPRSRCRITTGYTCDKHSAYSSCIATRHVDNSGFLRMHRHGWRFPQVKGPFWVRSGSGIPSISTAHAQDQCCCAQVIHNFVHSQQVSSPLAGSAGSSRSARRCLRVTQPPAGREAPGPCADEIGQEPSRERSPSPWVWASASLLYCLRL